jgi:uncharacterized membrane protein YtjA (UPF0391 family)
LGAAALVVCRPSWSPLKPPQPKGCGGFVLRGGGVTNPLYSASFPEPFQASAVLPAIQGRSSKMLYYAVVFLVIALVAGLLGFGGIAGASAGIAQILFFVFLALLVLSLIAGLFRRA